MTDQQTDSPRASLVVRDGRPLIGVPSKRDGQEVTVYFTDDSPSARDPSPEAIQRALGAIGAWTHLDWDEMEQELDRIRHQNAPTPPIEDL